MCCPELHEKLPPPSLAVFGISHQSGTSSFTAPVVWLEEKQRLATLTQILQHPPFAAMPMYLPSFLACASASLLICLKAKAQSLPSQAEVVPVSSDGSICTMGITKSHFAAH